MSKGSKRRPMKVPYKRFEEDWDRIFGSKKQRTNKQIDEDAWREAREYISES